MRGNARESCSAARRKEAKKITTAQECIDDRVFWYI